MFSYDFFLSRRGSVGDVAREVADVLAERGYKVLVQDYDFRLGDSVIDRMHDGVKNARDLIVLLTRDYEQSAFCRKEFTSFEAQRLSSSEERHMIILRCDDVQPEGLFADVIYQDLVGVQDREERKQRIIAAAERQTLAAPSPTRSFLAVPPRIPCFTGRDDQLDRLDAILTHEKPAVVTQAVGRVAVQGMGGVGKTSLAIEYAYRYRNLYAGVCWCPAETRASLIDALAGLGVALGQSRADQSDPEKVAKEALACLALQRAPWLLVYDNVASPSEIVELLPSAGARVLITSRFFDWTGLADEVGLATLVPDEAAAFLQSRAGREDATGARALAGALGYLPLALDHAAAYCKRTQMDFAEYAAKATNLISTVPRDATYPQSIAATFDLAISEVEARCSAAELMVGFLSYCAPVRIPIYFLQTLPDKEEAIAALAELSLIRHDPFQDGTPAVTIHRLVQAVARRRTEAKGAAETTMERVKEGLSMLPPPRERVGLFGALRDIIPHLRPLPHQRVLWRYQFEHLTKKFTDNADKLDHAAEKLGAAGHPDKAKTAREKAAELREKAARLSKIKFGSS
ncbi:TIR domain-containing protein [Bradyrhizobium sp. 2TAF36]|uniref:tetratricopeptide repeat protein n=1 Tax=Bradyrhizobium sp. 2TAF36 TaxID=3233016 RepID=UPI003F8FA3BC